MTAISNQPRRVKMASKMPSMTALLGLLAIAGYQNRDKIAEMLKGMGQSLPGQGQASSQPGGLGNVLGGLGNVFVNSGLGELLDRFKQNGHGATAEAWIKTGPNQEISPPSLKQAIGPDVLDALSKQTGLSTEEILTRLSKTLPGAVDQYTPDGRLPA